VAAGQVLLVGKHAEQAVTVGGWCGAVEDGDTAVAAAGSVVSSGGNALEAGIGCWRASPHGGGDVGAGEHLVDWN
jgi:hypothetical protein